MKTARALFVVIVLVLPAIAADSANYTLKKIGDGVYAAIATPGGKAGSNAGFVIGGDGVLVVDTFVDPAAARDLLGDIRKLTNLPVRYVVNTHYHVDHTAGNGVFSDAGADVLAHRNVRAWLRTENMKFFGATPKPEQKARVEALSLPDITYTQGISVHLGTRAVEVRFMPGHTGGDSVVFVPDANVVFGGDLVWQKHLPNLIDASTGPWIETLATLVAQHPAATFVSGHGDVATVQDVRDFRDYLVELRAEVAKAQAAGKSGDDLVSAVTAAIQEKYGAWGFYQNFVKRNIEQTSAELSGQKKIPTNDVAAQ